jgi:hypothetical protein
MSFIVLETNRTVKTRTSKSIKTEDVYGIMMCVNTKVAYNRCIELDIVNDMSEVPDNLALYDAWVKIVGIVNDVNTSATKKTKKDNSKIPVPKTANIIDLLEEQKPEITKEYILELINSSKNGTDHQKYVEEKFNEAMKAIYNNLADDVIRKISKDM